MIDISNFEDISKEVMLYLKLNLEVMLYLKLPKKIEFHIILFLFETLIPDNVAELIFFRLGYLFLVGITSAMEKIDCI